MKYRSVLAWCATLVLAAGLALPSRADIPVVREVGTLAATGSSPWLYLAGQSACSVVLSGTWTGTATPQGTSDTTLTTVATVSTIGAQTSNGTFSGSIADYTKAFRIGFTRSSGTLAYDISCTPAVSTAAVSVTVGTVSVSNTPGVAVQNWPSPGPTSSPGNVPLTVLANASAVPYSATTPLPVTTPAPAPTGAHGAVQVEGVASGTVVPVSGTVTVNTPAPYATASPNVLKAIPVNSAGTAYALAVPFPVGFAADGNSILTASSATTCTSLRVGATPMIVLTNTGPATTVFLQVFDEGSTPTCAAAHVIFGDLTTLTLGPGQVIELPGATNGIAYKLSGALTANVVVAW